MTVQARFQMKFDPHDGQIEVLYGMHQTPRANIYTLCASRGWGKTLFVVAAVVIPHILKRPNAQVMWVAPTYKICKSPVDDVFYGIDEETLQRFIPQFCPDTGMKFWEYFKADNEIHFWNGAKIFFRSADNPDSIVSKGFSLIIIDEAAIISEQVFNTQILATARRKNCKIFLISTPRGKNWFYHKYMDGQDASKDMYASFKQPWYKRPDYPQILKDLMLDLPEHIMRQEFFADFVEDGSSVLKNLEGVFLGKEIQFESQQQEWIAPVSTERKNQESFVVAVDLAKAVDYTVIIGLGISTREVVYYKRINKTSYKKVIKEIQKASAYLDDAEVIFDNTGVGAGLADFMSGLNAYPYTFTNESKNELINHLIMSCEYANLKIPNITTVKAEFEMFEYSLSRTGKITYSAPSGRNDDTVIAIALANWFAEQTSGTGEVHEIDSFLKLMQTNDRRSVFDKMMEEDD